jgi:hypothetical protein
MSFFTEEDNSFAFDNSGLLYEIDPLTSSVSSTTNVSSTTTNVSNESSNKKRSFIWKYCEDLRPSGWKCVVEKENGELCDLFFPYQITKGSTSNTISHLLKEHGIVSPNVAKKVYIIFICSNF